MSSAHSSASLPPGLWRGGDWLGTPEPVVPSGHAALDAELPAGGWPLGALTELLLEPLVRGEWALLLPALAARLQEGKGRAVLIAPPLEPFAAVLHAARVPAAQLCCIQPGPAAGAAAAAWACEQALRCRDVRAVLAWLPHAPPATLRRLQLAAAQHRQLLWVFRPPQARLAASPAPLRLWLHRAQQALLVHVLKRRGPPLARPVALPACPALLAETLAAQAQRRRQMQQAAARAAGAPAEVEISHALAGVAAAP